MGQSIPLSIRLAIVRSYQEEGLTYGELAIRYAVSYNSVRSFCRSYDLGGEESLLPDYRSCGRQVSVESERTYRLVRLIKHCHPLWGVPYITTRIRLRYPQLSLQSDRHYQRRIRADQPIGVLPAVKLPSKLSRDTPRIAHDEWQIDAKERIDLPDGTQACYLNITDTVSHALLKAKVFPPPTYFICPN